MTLSNNAFIDSGTETSADTATESESATSSDSVSDASDDADDIRELKRKVRKYKMRYKRSKETTKSATDQAEQANTHAILAGEHIKVLQGQVNAKKKKKDGNGRIIHIGSRIVTSQEGLEEAQKQKEARDAKAQLETERAQRKEDTQVAVRAERTQAGCGNMVFEGTLRNQKLQGLRNICWNLQLDETGTIPVLLDRIKKHFDANPLLRVDYRYIALFNTKRGTKRT
ncbi:hypothetical protein H0H93_015133, partial [Arthromyces matolae]